MQNSFVKHITIKGNVQGVGFRHFTRKNADDLRLHGWVQNKQDGSVEMVLAGEEKDVKEMTKRLWKGPALAHVTHVIVKESNENMDIFSEFNIRR